jgi:uncharacterized protein
MSIISIPSMIRLLVKQLHKVLLGTFIIIFMILFSSCKKNISDGVKEKVGDELALTDGLKYKVLISTGDELSEKQHYGYDNSGLALVASSDGDAKIWVGHESINTIVVSNYDPLKKHAVRDGAQIDTELAVSGASLLSAERFFGSWRIEKESSLKVKADQEIPFEWYEPIRGSSIAKGTVANGAATVSPWKSILSCENDYFHFYGGLDYVKDEYTSSALGWESFLQNPIVNFGYVVEMNPETKEIKKHVSLGRFPHGGISITPLPDGRVVIYTTDSRAGGCLYRYISDKPNQIYPGKLYVANFTQKKWLLIHYNELQEHFKSETEMMIKCALAANLTGGSPLERPSGVVYSELGGELILAIAGGDEIHFGKIIKLKPILNHQESDDFDFDDLVVGKEGSFSQPTSLVFDKVGNLWFTSRMPADQLGVGKLASFGNNGLFVMLNVGQQKGSIIQVATAPRDSNFGGLCFSPNGKTLFATVQNIGKISTSQQASSGWNIGNGDRPRPALVAITGGFLEAIRE